MKIVLLSGNTDKRLWPLSGNAKAKQFINFFNVDNEYLSMIQIITSKIKEKCANAEVFVTSKKNQISTIKSQLVEDVSVIVEPELKGTFPAALISSLYLTELNKANKDDVVIFLPVDMYADDDYFSLISQFENAINQSNFDLILMGANPTYPSEKYGYISSNSNEIFGRMNDFKINVTKDEAQKLIDEGYLWNCGLFACRLGKIIEIGHYKYNFDDYFDIFNKYNMIEKSSLDNILINNVSSIGIVRYNGQWKDIGTWNTLTEVMTDNILGNVVLDNNCENTHIINELDIPVLGMGLKDIVVAASSNGILVSNKHDSSYILPFVESFDNKTMYAEKSWGSFKVVDVQDESMTLSVTLKQGNKMKYHSHDFRDEVWTIVSGNGRTVVDGMEQLVKAGDVVTIQAGCKHTIIAETDLKIIEVQIGKEINVNDKHKYKFED